MRSDHPPTLRHAGLTLVLTLLVACSKAAPEQGPALQGEVPDAGTSDAAGPASDAGAAGSPTIPPDGPRYPDAPDAPAPKAWEAPVLEPVIAAGPDDDWHAHDNTALAALETMYLPGNGTFDAGWRWTFANAVEAVESSYLRTGGENHLDMVVGTHEKQKYDQFVSDGGYDDQLWWAHAWIRAYELTGDATYLESAKTIFTDTLKGWEPAVCGGGVWWQKKAVYKNAITNELFLLVAASLHNHVAGDAGPGSYLDWANKAWAWFSESGMINDEGLINDGLNDACENNDQTTWTYNQGVILGALVEMYIATGDAAFLTSAKELADASTTKLVTDQGILTEPCGGECNYDQLSFKGLYLRNLLRLYDWTHEARYYDFMLKNARSLWLNARDENRLGSNWSGPYDAPSSTRQSSGMFALSALADKYSGASLFLRPSGGPSFTHAVGERAGLLAWACDAAICPTAGSMQGGPYVAYLPPGVHTLHVQMSADRTSTLEGSLGTLDVFDVKASQVVATREIAWKDFVEPNVTQDFTLDYAHGAADSPLEFRVQWHALPDAPRLTISDVSIDGEQSFSAANLNHECGRLDASWHWTTDRFRDPAPCVMTRGPGVRLAEGEYVAHFELKVDEFAIDEAPIAVVSVVNREEGKVISSGQIVRRTFGTTLFATFALPFTAFEGYHYEFLTEWLAEPTAPRLTQRGVHLRRATVETTVALPYNAASSFDAYTLGAERNVHYHPFVLAEGNVVTGGAADVAVPPGKYRTLELLTFANAGTQPAQDFTLVYDDGSSQTVTRSISDWLAASPQPDERIAFNVPYRLEGTVRQYGNYHVFRHSLPLDASKTLQAFRLPANPNVKVLAATLSAPK